MKLAILNNNSSIGYLLSRELEKRGHQVDLYAGHNSTSDNGSSIDISTRNLSLPRKVLRKSRLWLRLERERYDVQLVLGGHPLIGIHARDTMNYWQGIEVKENYALRFNEKHSFISTLDLQDASPNSVLLPRPVNIELFKAASSKQNAARKLVGHFWRRGNITFDYAMRYYKATDILLEALRLLPNFTLFDDLLDRIKFPIILRQLAVLAEQFRVGSYGLPAIESLLVGTPVVGYYRKELVECPEAFELLTPSTKNPENIARLINEVAQTRVSGTKTVEEYHSAKHTADIFEDQIAVWGLN